MSAYPDEIDNLPDLDGHEMAGSYQYHADVHSAEEAAIVAVQVELGLNPSGTFGTVAERLANTGGGESGQGAKGDKGDKGEPGPAGPKGDRGEPGETENLADYALKTYVDAADQVLQDQISSILGQLEPERGNAQTYRFKEVAGNNIASRAGEICVNHADAADVTLISIAPQDLYNETSKAIGDHDRIAFEVLNGSGQSTGRVSTFAITGGSDLTAISVAHSWSGGGREPFAFNEPVNLWVYSSTPGVVTHDELAAALAHDVRNDAAEKPGQDAENVIDQGSITFNNVFPADRDTFAFETNKNGEPGWLTFGTTDDFWDHQWTLNGGYMVWRNLRDGDEVVKITRDGLTVGGENVATVDEYAAFRSGLRSAVESSKDYKSLRTALLDALDEA